MKQMITISLSAFIICCVVLIFVINKKQPAVKLETKSSANTGGAGTSYGFGYISGTVAKSGVNNVLIYDPRPQIIDDFIQAHGYQYLTECIKKYHK